MRFTYTYRKMAKLFANSGDSDQRQHSVSYDLGLHCLPITLLRVSRLQWVKTAVIRHLSPFFLYFCMLSVHKYIMVDTHILELPV